MERLKNKMIEICDGDEKLKMIFESPIDKEPKPPSLEMVDLLEQIKTMEKKFKDNSIREEYIERLIREHPEDPFVIKITNLRKKSIELHYEIDNLSVEEYNLVEEYFRTH